LTVLGLYSHISAPINVKFGTRLGRAVPRAKFHVYQGNMSPLQGEKPIFGLLSKNNTDMAVLCAGLPVKTDRCKLVTSTRDFTALYGITSNINNSSCLMNCLRAWKLYQAFLVLIHKVNV